MKAIGNVKRGFVLVGVATALVVFGQNFVSTTVSIADYGAKGDGQTDNTNAINSAIAAAQNIGATVYIPSGTYVYSDVLRITGIKIQGAGDSSILYATNPERESIFIYGNNAGVSNLKLSGRVSAWRQAAWESTRITLFGATNFTIDSVTIDTSAAAGIQTDGGVSNGVIKNSHISNTLADSIHLTSRASYVTVENNLIENSGDDGIAVVSYGYDNGYVNNITARNNRILNNKHGRNMSVVGGKNILYENNYMDGNPNWACVYIAQEGNYGTYGAHDVTVQYNTMKNCGNTTTGHGAVMVYSDGAEPNERIKFIRNDVIQNGQAGFRIFSANNFAIQLDSNRVTGASPDYDITSTDVSLIRYTSGSVGYSSGASPSPSPSPTVSPTVSPSPSPSPSASPSPSPTVSPSSDICASANEGGFAEVQCPAGQVISSVSFASYGTAVGSCGSYQVGSCNASSSQSFVENACLGKQSCSLRAQNESFGDPCGGTAKKLVIAVKCGAVVNPSPSPSPSASPSPTVSPSPSASPSPSPTVSPSPEPVDPAKYFGTLALFEGVMMDVGNGMSLVMQGDGNLVLYASVGPLWATGTKQTCNGNCSAFFQNDGNFVLYNNGQAFWSTGTYGSAGRQLKVSPTKPYLQIINGSSVLWQSQ